MARNRAPSFEQIDRGHVIVRGYLLLILAISAGMLALHVILYGMASETGLRIVGLLFTIPLCIWMWRGSVAARWIMVVWLAIDGGVSLIMAIWSGDARGLAALGGIALVYLSFVVVMGTSRSVAAFLACQRDKYEPV